MARTFYTFAVGRRIGGRQMGWTRLLLEYPPEHHLHRKRWFWLSEPPQWKNRPTAVCGVCRNRYLILEVDMEEMRKEWVRFEGHPASDEEIVRALQPNLCPGCARR